MGGVRMGGVCMGGVYGWSAGPGGAEGIQRMYMWQRQWQRADADSRGRGQSAIGASIVAWEVCMGGVCMGGVCMGGVCMGGVCMGGAAAACSGAAAWPCALRLANLLAPESIF
jgi:hypothetical protein